MGSTHEFPDPRPVTCAYEPTCGGAAQYVINVAAAAADTKEIVACPDCVETFLDGYGTTETQVRELEPAERWRGDWDA